MSASDETTEWITGDDDGDDDLFIFYACDIDGHVGGGCTAVQVPRTGQLAS